MDRYNAGRYWRNQCRISSDIVSYLMNFRGYSYPDVLNFMKGKPVTPSGIPVKEREVVELNHRWVNSSLQLVVQCNQRLNRDTAIQEVLLRDRGIPLETANRFMLSWNHTDQYIKRKKWNLPAKYHADGSEKKMVLPAGLVIPHYYGGSGGGVVSSVRIRRKYNTDKYGKYHFVGATDIEPLHIRPDINYRGTGVIITEGELDAIRVVQEFANVDISSSRFNHTHQPRHH